VMAGEQRNAKLLYLAATSRLLDKCINVAVKGPSSAGKSEIRKRVLSFIPPEDVVSREGTALLGG
jgi:ABC-type iron transport system FetAB ATPase subunit